MRAFPYLLTALATLALSASAQARTTSLDQWQFSRDGASWETVTVPHSTNAVDGRSAAYYRGQTHYRRTFRANPARPAFLQFEGAAQAADVYVNGQLARTHKGGYTPFTVPLRDLLQRGKAVLDQRGDNPVGRIGIALHRLHGLPPDIEGAGLHPRALALQPFQDFLLLHRQKSKPRDA